MRAEWSLAVVVACGMAAAVPGVAAKAQSAVEGSFEAGMAVGPFEGLLDTAPAHVVVSKPRHDTVKASISNICQAPIDDFFEEGELPPEEPEGWHPAVPCPQCGGAETQFVTRHYERSVYECARCGRQFETEEP